MQFDIILTNRFCCPSNCNYAGIVSATNIREDVMIILTFRAKECQAVGICSLYRPECLQQVHELLPYFRFSLVFHCIVAFDSLELFEFEKSSYE